MSSARAASLLAAIQHAAAPARPAGMQQAPSASMPALALPASTLPDPTPPLAVAATCVGLVGLVGLQFTSLAHASIQALGTSGTRALPWACLVALALGVATRQARTSSGRLKTGRFAAWCVWSIVAGVIVLWASVALELATPSLAGRAHLLRSIDLQQRQVALVAQGVDLAHPDLGLPLVDVRAASPDQVSQALARHRAAPPLTGELALRWIAAARIGGYLTASQATALMAQRFVPLSQRTAVRAHALANPPSASASPLKQAAWLRLAGEAPLIQPLVASPGVAP